MDSQQESCYKRILVFKSQERNSFLKKFHFHFDEEWKGTGEIEWEWEGPFKGDWEEEVDNEWEDDVIGP